MAVMQEATAYQPPTHADSVHEIICTLGAGNPGALSVLSVGYKEHGTEFVARVAAGGLRGPAIWMYYKDTCENDLDVMYQMLEPD